MAYTLLITANSISYCLDVGKKEQRTDQDSNSSCSPEYKEWSLLINLEMTFTLELLSLEFQFEINKYGYRKIQKFDVQLNNPDTK